MGKILYVASTISHINNFHTDYINALRADGHTVMVMARGEGADFDIPFEKKLLSAKNKKCRKMIREIIDREGFDAVILNTSLAAFHVRAAMRRKNRPWCINFVHGYLFSRGGGIKDKILLMCERIHRRKTDKILVMNEEDFAIATEGRLSLYGVEMTLGMGAKCKSPIMTSDEVRGQIGAEGKFLLSFVGELSGRKNQAFLLAAVERLKRDIPSILLCLVGDGGAKDELIERARELDIEENVAFVGPRANPCDFIRASDVYVSASKIEGMPFNIIEALGTDTPIVASDIKGHRDLIKDGENGFLYSLECPCRLADIIRDIHSGARNILIDAMHRTYSEYCFENVFEKTYKILKGALENEREA